MGKIKDFSVTHWVVAGLAAVSFILVLKVASTKLPDAGVLGALKNVIASI